MRLDDQRRRSLRPVILAVDALLVLIAMGLAFGAHVALRASFAELREPPAFEAYAGLVVTALPLWLVLIVSLGLDRVAERAFTRWTLIRELGKLHVAGLVGLTVVLFLTRGVINRSMVALFLGSSFLLLYLERALIGRWLAFQYGRGHGRTRLLLVGADSPSMRSFIAAAAARDFPAEIVGRLSPVSDSASVPPPGIEGSAPPPSLGHVDELERVLHENPLDGVIFFPPLHEPAEAAEALQLCEVHGVPASFSLVLAQPHRAVPRIVQLGDDHFVAYDVAPKSPAALAIKHGFDVVAAALGLLVLSPLLVVTSLAILITMGRPIFYSQVRAGFRGRPFKFLKFRSMVVDAEARKHALRAENETGGPTFKMTADPRITRLGRFLRRTSIDELPQLVHVLFGTMSLVGPRPLPIDEQRNIHGWHRRRLSMKPGLTCLWQVSGRSSIGFEEWMQLDLKYVDDWSLWLDVVLLARTVPAVLSGRGAK